MKNMLMAQKAADFMEDSHLTHVAASLAASTLGEYDECGTRSSILEDISKSRPGKVS
jgi:hypothetical protein